MKSTAPRHRVSEPDPGYLYSEFSELAGPLQDAGENYQVAFKSVTTGGTRVRAYLLVGAALLFEAFFLGWLLKPSHYPQGDGTWQFWMAVTMVVSIGIIESMRLLNVSTLAFATLNARDPIPVKPARGLRIAFVTTIVPSKEPISMARKTLEAAMQVRHDGPFDVWLLDEGNDPDVKAMCAELGVNHMSRKDIPEWNQETGRNKARTKHGNYNAWLDAHGHDYDLWVSVDTDHVPLPNFAERLIGYFQDPDVAFVVGPQVYGNYDNFVTRAAESQQYLFHSVLQRAANRFGSAMFVGTNNAVRISALMDIGGLQDSVTEDAASSILWHSRKNPATGNRWKSVYTPDVLAVGEGPTSWTDYFIQQGRWARGTDEVILRKFARAAVKLGRGRRLHYAMLMSYYPSAGIAWILGTFNMTTYLLTGVGGVKVAAQLWLMLYVNAAVLQMGIYFWNRRHNVSPHEEEGSSGVTGMFVSILSAPMYVTALIDAIRGRNISFAVTPKGEDGSPDRLSTFRKHLQWAAVLTSALVASVFLGNDHIAMRSWAVMGLMICLLPMLLWWGGLLRARLNRSRPPRVIVLPRDESATTGAARTIRLDDDLATVVSTRSSIPSADQENNA